MTCRTSRRGTCPPRWVDRPVEQREAWDAPEPSEADLTAGMAVGVFITGVVLLTMLSVGLVWWWVW